MPIMKGATLLRANIAQLFTRPLREIVRLIGLNKVSAVFAAILVTMCVLGGPVVAQTGGWHASGVSGSDYGPDYQAAALASLKAIYGYDVADKGMHFSGPMIFNACHSWVAGSTLCGIAYPLDCPSHTAWVVNGCISSVSGYQGPCNCKPQKPVGDPMSPLSGNLFEEVEDFATTGASQLTAKRYYNSNVNYVGNPYAQRPGRFGFGWRSEYDRYLVFTLNSKVDAITAEGTPLHFNLVNGNWVLVYWNFAINNWSAPRLDVDYRLTTDGTYWYLTDGNDTTDKYDSTGNLLTISYRGGYQQTLTYDGSGNNTVISDNLGRQITFSYSSEAVATSLTDPDSNVIQYTYVDKASIPQPGSPSLRVLSTVTYPAASGTPTLTYLYEDPNPINRFALTGMVDENGHRYATWTYDGQGRTTSSQLAVGVDATTISYNDTTNARTVTNAFGKQFTYATNTFEGVLQQSSIAGAATAHTAATTESYSYDSNGFVSQYTDANGNITTYIHNTIGQETSRTEAYGTPVARTITTTWDTTWREPDEIVAPNLTTDFSYDPSGRLSILKLTDTATQKLPYSTNGQTRIWNYTYTPTGLLQTVDGPLAGSGDTTTYGYDAHGFVNSITDVLGHVTTISAVNGRGQPLTSVDPNGITTNYTYDLRGRVLSITINPGAGQAQYGFTYDAAENLTQIARPDSSTLTYAYDDAHRITSVTNNLGESITYTLDALGNRTATVTKSAGATITKQETATFDELGRVMANIGAASQTTAHAYDLNNNEITTTDPRSKVYGHAFDALNRLYQETDPDLFHTTTTFDKQDNPVSVTDARSLTTTYIRDGFGEVIRQVSPDTGTTDFWYDANGAVIKQIDARYVEADFTNDNAGRVLARTYPAASAENVTYTYDATGGGNKGVGKLTSVSDQSGSTSLVYDSLGQVSSDTRVIVGNSYGTSYTYDPAGNILTETYPSGRIVTYTRDVLGRISGITTKQNSGASAVPVVSSGAYQPFGPLSGFTFGNGLVLSQTYDLDYQLTGINAANGGTTVQNLTNGFDPASNITSITDNLTSARSQTVTYDDLNRVLTANGIYGAQTYTYDGVGNRSSLAVGSTTNSYTYASTANQITTISSPASPPGAGTAGTYLYNAFRQRVQKVVGATTTQFVYDQAGHLIEETDGSGTAQKEYIWLDDMPVAMVDDTGASPVLYYIHTDQLGTPQKLTDGSMNVVWDGVFDPFGNPASGASLALTNLRFPGQYFDAEVALNQNWNRDYDPTTGRYIQSDPLGLAGGVNSYAYVDGDPISESDFEGKFGIAGALVGGGIDLAIQLLEHHGNIHCVDPMEVGVSMLLGTVGGEFGVIADADSGLAVGMSRANAAFPKGTEWVERSHWIPKRWGGPMSKWNIKLMWGTDHALADPMRYQFMRRWWKVANELQNPLTRLWNRTPGWFKGAVAGGATGAATGSGECGCQ